MEVVVTTGAIGRAKLQSNHHHQQTNTQFLRARCPSCRPTNSVKALNGSVKALLLRSDFYFVPSTLLTTLFCYKATQYIITATCRLTYLHPVIEVNESSAFKMKSVNNADVWQRRW